VDNSLEIKSRLDLAIRETRAAISECRVRVVDLQEQLRQLEMFLEVYEARRNAQIRELEKRNRREASKRLPNSA
jgi:hypothetical protein